MYALTQQGQLLAKGNLTHCWNSLILSCQLHHQKPTVAQLVGGRWRTASDHSTAGLGTAVLVEATAT